MADIRNILLPIDFSESSMLAARYGVELARKFSAKLHLLHVIEDPVIYLPMFETYSLPTREEFEAFAQTQLENWVLPDGAEELAVERRWVHGTPFAQIVKDAQTHAIDLIILGTHGRGAAAHLLMGSVAEKVVRKAPCPVLTVRPQDHQFVHPAAPGGEPQPVQ